MVGGEPLFTIGRTEYFQCRDQVYEETMSSAARTKEYPSFPGMERTTHYCIDYSNEVPVFVRGTFSMVGYFEGFLKVFERTADITW